jgi:hypothetical protein
MLLKCEGTVWNVTERIGRKKDGTEFKTCEVSILQEGQKNMAIVKCPVEDAPGQGEVVCLSVYPRAWVGRSGNANVDFYLSKEGA